MCILIIVLACIAAALAVIAYGNTTSQHDDNKTNNKETENDLKPPPGPRPLPLIGSLHLLGSHETPFQAFTALSKKYGDVFSITLGTTKCVVVNNFNLIKEVLITKGGDFGGRPDFIRFHKLFGGDRNNSLALCDWSALQKTRRSIARTYCSPRFTSLQYDHVNLVGSNEVMVFLNAVQQKDTSVPVDIKPLVLAACMNMFTQYMCSTSFDYEDDHFKHVVRTFDEIFWEINQGYAVDFLPWLLPAYKGHMRKLGHWASDIRQFILTRIIDERRLALDTTLPPRDFTDALLIHLIEDEDVRKQQEYEKVQEIAKSNTKHLNTSNLKPKTKGKNIKLPKEVKDIDEVKESDESGENLNWQHIIFELEDFLGGHSAIGNLIMITLASVVGRKEVVKKIQDEIYAVTGNQRLPTLLDKENMPYTEAVIWEALRTASSPIVPHVATTTTMIDGYRVDQGTVLFVNNYELNVGEAYWDKPEQFLPERFISPAGHVVKPAHFIPFSTGKRTCIGQRLVQCFSFMLVAALFQNYDVEQTEAIHLVPSCVAVPPDAFKLRLTPRQLSK